MCSREATAALNIPNIKVINHFFESAESKGLFTGLGSTFAVWKSSIKVRLASYINDRNLILATFLDPRFKDRFFENEYYSKSASEAITSWLVKDHIDTEKPKDGENIVLIDSSESANSDDDQGTEFNFSYGKCFSDLKKKKSLNKKKNRKKFRTSNLKSRSKNNSRDYKIPFNEIAY